jgi:hypothetical protein
VKLLKTVIGKGIPLFEPKFEKPEVIQDNRWYSSSPNVMLHLPKAV